MGIELDHLFVCTAQGAPEAEKLLELGFHEGPPSEHLGQGSACRRFSFTNTMIELFWVSDEGEARSEYANRTSLWERWSGREHHSSPFGICLRPSDSEEKGPPFPTWEYRPAYLSDSLLIHIGEAEIEEPMWVYLSFMRRSQREQWFVEHPIGVREISGLSLTSPVPLRSRAAEIVVESGVLSTRPGTTSILEIEFDNRRRNKTVDLRPHLPLIFQL